MIRARINNDGDGHDLILLGITEANIVRLREGQPILANLEPLGVPGTDLLVLLGDTHAQLADVLAQAGLPLPPEAASQVAEADRP